VGKKFKDISGTQLKDLTEEGKKERVV